MSVLSDLFSDIAKAIRSKTGETGTMKPLEFPAEIEAIEATSGADEINTLIDKINGEVINGYTVAFIGADGAELCTVSVVPGFDCPNPVVTELISRPTKEPTVSEQYTFSGWSLTDGGDADSAALQNVTEDRTVYAAFTASVRMYTIRYYNGDELLNTVQVAYGESAAAYTYEITGSRFMGWNPDPESVAVESDMDCYGTWQVAAWSADTWDDISTALWSGTYSEFYKEGDERVITLNYQDGTSEDIVFQIVDVDGSEVVDGDYHFTVLAKSPLKSSEMFFNTQLYNDTSTIYTWYGFAQSDVYTYLMETVYPALPSGLQALIKPALKKYSKYNVPNMTVTTPDEGFPLWIPSAREVSGSPSNLASNEHYEIYSSMFGTTMGNATNEARVMKVAGSDTAVRWHTRTVNSATSTYVVSETGAVSGSYNNCETTKAYVVFGFCI